LCAQGGKKGVEEEIQPADQPRGRVEFGGETNYLSAIKGCLKTSTRRKGLDRGVKNNLGNLQIAYRGSKARKT